MSYFCQILFEYFSSRCPMQVLAADGSARGPPCNAKAATCHVVLAFRQSVRTAVPVLLRAMPIQSRSSLSARTVIFLSNIIAPPRDSTCEDCLAHGIPLKESCEAAPTDRCHASNHCVGASISQPAPQSRTRQDVILMLALVAEAGSCKRRLSASTTHREARDDRPANPTGSAVADSNWNPRRRTPSDSQVDRRVLPDA